MLLTEALSRAREQGWDLICVAPNEKVPVCKITDFGKFRYELMKKEREAKKGQRAHVLKELKISPKISNHDYEVKMNRSKNFLEKGNKVKVNVFFRGREIAHANLGRLIVDRLLNDLNEWGIPESTPRLEGKNLIVIVAPKQPEKKNAKAGKLVNE